MNEWIDWFQRVLDVSIRLYFRQECDLSSVYDIALPKAGPLWKALLLNRSILLSMSGWC